MSWRIIQQPDGLWSIYSTVVEDFVCTDFTEDELRKFYVDYKTECAVKEYEKNIDEFIDKYKTTGSDWFDETYQDYVAFIGSKCE